MPETQKQETTTKYVNLRKKVKENGVNYNGRLNFGEVTGQEQSAAGYTYNTYERSYVVTVWNAEGKTQGSIRDPDKQLQGTNFTFVKSETKNGDKCYKNEKPISIEGTTRMATLLQARQGENYDLLLILNEMNNDGGGDVAGNEISFNENEKNVEDDLPF